MTDVSTDDAAAGPARDEALLRRRAEIGGGGLRKRVAGGTIVNAVFMVGMHGLSITQGLLLAALLGAAEYGLWGLLTVTFGTLFGLAAVGLDDKYIQQDHPDQQAAFEIAFTLQSMLCGLFTVIALVMIPLFSLLYDAPQILVPGLLLALALPLIALQTPVWVFYRRMDFVKQRLLEACSPVSAFIVSVSLALAGFGFWSLVAGSLVGGVIAGAVAVVYSPYKLRFRYERGALREYASFSWPLFAASGSTVLMFQVPVTIAARTLGSAAVGAITITSQITLYAKRVDDIVTHALYPAVCAVKDQRDLLFESFSKSNRLALLWGIPFGVAAAIFAERAVPAVLGDDWALAVPLIQILGLNAAVDQIGFNWTAFARARGETRVIALASVVMLVATLGVGVPLLLAHGLQGFALGLAAGTLANLVVRLAYLARLFPAARMLDHVVRSVLPTVPAAVLILLGRALLPGDTGLRLAAELGVYAVLVAAVTWWAERPLLRESIGYLRRTQDGTATAPAD